MKKILFTFLILLLVGIGIDIYHNANTTVEPQVVEVTDTIAEDSFPVDSVVLDTISVL